MAGEGQKQKDKRLALRRIEAIFEQIDRMEPFTQDTADAYIHKVWNLSTKNRIRLPVSLKRRFCRKCKCYWRMGKTVRVRITKGRKIYTCLVCSTIKRVPFK